MSKHQVSPSSMHKILDDYYCNLFICLFYEYIAHNDTTILEGIASTLFQHLRSYSQIINKW